MSIDFQKAKLYANSECKNCEGKGWVSIELTPDDHRDDYCYCAKENMAEADAERQEDK